MQEQQQDGPRIGEPPPSGHWAAGIPGFSKAGGLAHGFDCLAGEAGLADGLSALLKACNLTIEQVISASPGELRDWYYRCYAEYSGKSPAGAWDVVAFSGGIHCHDSGWSPPDPPAPLERRPYRRKPAPRLCRGYVAGSRTDEYVMPVPA